MEQIAACIAAVCENLKAQTGEQRILPGDILEKLSHEVKAICARFPLYKP
jgi:glycine/serine hydroxymethyltransferase